ncbi:MAG: serine/threonine-protein kinase [Longimicrobiales bacterium]
MSEPFARLNAGLKGRYRIEREMGEGGMAAVYLARDLHHERRVALKVLKPELTAVVGAERFLAEIRTTANLQHPHFLPLFDSDEANSFMFYLMPCVDGESLRERLDREHQLPVDEAVRLAANVAEALDYAYRRGVVHAISSRPISCFRTASRSSRISGSRWRSSRRRGSTDGNRHRARDASVHVSGAGDWRHERVCGHRLYALGCVLYEMLVGEPPSSRAAHRRRFSAGSTPPGPTPSPRTAVQFWPTWRLVYVGQRGGQTQLYVRDTDRFDVRARWRGRSTRLDDGKPMIPGRVSGSERIAKQGCELLRNGVCY